MPKDGSCCICFSIIVTDSVFEMSKNYYPQLFRKVQITCQRKKDGKIFWLWLWVMPSDEET